MFGKIAIIGAGSIGRVLFDKCAERGYSYELTLIDIVEGLAEGIVEDVLDGLKHVGKNVTAFGGTDFSLMSGADVVIVTAGIPRKRRADGTMPSRDDLLLDNVPIGRAVAAQIKEHAPESIVINIANPLDAMMQVYYRELGFDPGRLIGMAGALDSARFVQLVAKTAGVSITNVSAMVLGGHGDSMVPLYSTCLIEGQPAQEKIPKDVFDDLVAQTRKRGGKIVGLLKSGSAFVSPAQGTLRMVEAILRDKKEIIPACIRVQNKYGLKDLFIGVPVKIGRDGAEEIIEYNLNEDEKAAFAKSADAVQTVVDKVGHLYDLAEKSGWETALKTAREEAKKKE